MTEEMPPQVEEIYQQAEYVVTCATEGCTNEGISIKVTADATDPNFNCGPCGREIEDVAQQAKLAGNILDSTDSGTP